MTEVARLIDIIAEELFHQSRTFSDAADAPDVYDHHSGADFIAVDGTINLRKLAEVIIARTRT